MNNDHCFFHIDSKASLISLIFILFASLFLLSSCSGLSALTPTPAHSRYSIDVDLKEYYLSLGGEPVLGPVITGLITHEDGVKCQFTENVLICFNPLATYADRISLLPLGRSFHLKRFRQPMLLRLIKMISW